MYKVLYKHWCITAAAVIIYCIVVIEGEHEFCKYCDNFTVSEIFP